MAAQVTTNARTCGDCQNALFGPGGVYCREYQQDIWDESTAADCPSFESVRPSSATFTRDFAPVGEGCGLPAPAPAVDQVTKRDVDLELWKIRRVSPPAAEEVLVELGVQNGRAEVDDEAERRVTLRLSLPYFGRAKHGDDLLATFTRLIQLHYPRAAVEKVDD